MNIPKSPLNNIIVEISEKHKEEIQTESGIKFFQDTTYRPEWHVTITGKVVSVPDKLNGAGWTTRANIKPEVQVGDELIFSYLVIFDLAHTDDRDEVFYEDPMGDPFLTQYSNKLGVKLIVKYRYETGNFERWDVAMFDDKGILYEMHQKLSQLQKDNWLGKFTFAETNKMTYNNLIEIDGKDYWKVDYGYAIAVRRKTEQGNLLIPIGGHVLLNPPMRIDPNAGEGKIQLLNRMEFKNYDDRARVIAIGEPLKGQPKLDCNPGDVVIYDRRYAERYELWGKDCIVLKQKQLLAKL